MGCVQVAVAWRNVGNGHTVVSMHGRINGRLWTWLILPSSSSAAWISALAITATAFMRQGKEEGWGLEFCMSVGFWQLGECIVNVSVLHVRAAAGTYVACSHHNNIMYKLPKKNAHAV
jgi:hypothetical protein